MELDNAIKYRRSCRDFKDQLVSKEISTIERMVFAFL